MRTIAIVMCMLVAAGCRDRAAPPPPTTKPPVAAEDSMPPPAHDAPASNLPTLASQLDGVTKMVISPVQGVTPPFAFTRKIEVTGADLAALIAAMGPDRPATDGRPRCLTALSAELLAADGSRKGYLDLFCAAGTDTPVAVILGSVREVSWMFADPAAGQALLEKLGR